VFSGKRPAGLGVRNGLLSACPDKPNCVNSQAADPRHHIAPLAFSGKASEAMARLKTAVESLPRTKIISESPAYLHAESKSAVFGFIDDVEFYLDEPAQLIHVRSASRLGYSDFGVNRKRIETVRSRFGTATG
jgi:uncharacterized protein (DUF1499 family)